jgi:hypothetical protein
VKDMKSKVLLSLDVISLVSFGRMIWLICTLSLQNNLTK